MVPLQLTWPLKWEHHKLSLVSKITFSFTLPYNTAHMYIYHHLQIFFVLFLEYHSNEIPPMSQPLNMPNHPMSSVPGTQRLSHLDPNVYRLVKNIWCFMSILGKCKIFKIKVENVSIYINKMVLYYVCPLCTYTGALVIVTCRGANS